MWGSDIRGDSILTLIATFFRVMHVSTGANMSHAPSIEQSVMVSGRDRGRGRGHGCDFGGRGSFGGDHGSYAGRQAVGDKGSGNVSIAGETGPSLRNAGRSLVTLNGHSWLMLILLPLVILLIFMLLQPLTLVLLAPTVIISQEEYDRMRQFEFSQNSHSATHASSSSMSAYIASPQKPLILYSEATSHMTSIK